MSIARFFQYLSAAGILVALAEFIRWTNLDRYGPALDWNTFSKTVDQIWTIIPVSLGFSLVTGVMAIMLGSLTGTSTWPGKGLVIAAILVGIGLLLFIFSMRVT